MKLIILNPIVPTNEIGCTSIQFRIPPLPLMKRCPDIKSIIHLGRSFNIPVKWYELLSPIQEDSYSGHIETVFPIYGSFYKYRKAYSQIHQCKEMPPHKPQRFLSFTPYRLYRIHDSSPLNCYQITPPVPKNTFQFIRLNEMDNIQTFHKKLFFQGGNTHVIF